MVSALEPDEIVLDRILLLGRARALARDWMVGVSRGGVWSVPIAALALWHRDDLAWPWWFILLAWLATAVTIGAVCVWQGRTWRRDYAKHLDAQLEAGDRIASAAEFVRRADDDPFLRLAVREAENWIARSGQAYASRRWPLDARLMPVAGAMLLGMLYFTW